MTEDEAKKLLFRELAIFGILIGVFFVGDFVQSSLEVGEGKKNLVHCVFAAAVAVALVIKVAVWRKRRGKCPPRSKIWD